MQEPSEEKDEQICTDVNNNINNPPKPGGNGAAGGDAGLGGLDQNQLLQFLANAQVRLLINFNFSICFFLKFRCCWYCVFISLGRRRKY
jgi:hypothetical protein